MVCYRRWNTRRGIIITIAQTAEVITEGKMTNKEAIEVIDRLFIDSTNENYPFTEEFERHVNGYQSTAK